MTNTTTAAPPEVHPDWCALDDCYNQLPDAATHSTPMLKQGAAEGQVTQLVDWVGGHNLYRTPVALAWMNGESVGDLKPHLSAADCRDLAAVLLTMADKLDELAR